MNKNREAGVPYPVSDEIDQETGIPIQPQNKKIVDNTQKSLQKAILSWE